MTVQVASLYVGQDLAPTSRRHLPVVSAEAMLRKQHQLTAVEEFSERHDRGDLPDASPLYRELLPLTRPLAGEQYAFEVSLDACTGCKACVAGCHTLNGLDEAELWRTVGFLHGGTPEAPALQTVTTSCHHCLEPACMTGCPVKAYEKDPITGIVKHLDDQCIGCQYCTLMCPYDAPKYNKARGIVRKCDMCSDRLSNGEAPACVQACPNGAIAVRVVSRDNVVRAGEAQAFLPGAPAPEATLPSTIYKSQRSMPSNMLPADFYRTHPEHSHPALIVMLTLTQLSVGACITTFVVERWLGRPIGHPLAQAALASLTAVLALTASIFHLGRPLAAWRAFLGLKTSWLSREVLTFGLYTGSSISYSLLLAAASLPRPPVPKVLFEAVNQLQAATAVFGLSGVFSSVMVYVATRRPQWNAMSTGSRFFGTMFVLGGAAVLAIAAYAAPALVGVERGLLWLVLGAVATKLILESRTLLNIRDRRHSAGKRVAVVMLGDLVHVTGWRFGLAVLGGILMPTALLRGWFSLSDVPLACAAMMLLLLGSELLERRLFFSAAPASRMPGALR
ncbi:MAG TPA: DmsC/YnfH family molybdoenzyme membrane anchor subunit [Polyangiaceae bacterium]